MFCDFCNLTTLDLSKNTNLITLSCCNNPLTTLTLPKGNGLRFLYCVTCQLTTLDVSDNPGLAILYCCSNQLTSLKIANSGYLYDLECYQNQLKGAAVDEIIANLNTSNSNNYWHFIRFVQGEGNVITKAQVEAAKQKNWIVQSLSENATQWVDYEGSEPEPTPDGIAIDATNFPDEKFRNFLLEQDYGQDGILTESEIANCTKMEPFFLEATSLKGIEYFTALKELRCYANNMTELDLSQNTALETLICHNTPLTSIDLSKNTALKELDLINDQLTSLDLSQNTALRVLEISGNPLTAIDLSNNTALMELHCKRNQLTTLDVSKNTALLMIECDDNQLTEIDITKNTLLMVLACSNNLIHTINVSPDCTMLRAIDCRHNQLKGASVDALIQNLPTRDADEVAMIGFCV